MACALSYITRPAKNSGLTFQWLEGVASVKYLVWLTARELPDAYRRSPVQSTTRFELDNSACIHRYSVVLRLANLDGQFGFRCRGGHSDQFATGSGDIGGVRTLDVLCVRVAAKYHSLGVMGSSSAMSE
jgi:hypothetical protein